MEKQKLIIPFTDSDIEELRRMTEGDSFDWEFETDKGEAIEVKIIRAEFDTEIYE